MKRIVLLIIMITFSIVSCTNDDSNNNFSLVEEVRDSLGNLNIIMDPRIELLTAVQQQAQYDVLTRFDFNYKNEMNEHFSSYKKHKAVKTFSKLSKIGFAYDAPPNVMLYLTDTLSIDENTYIPNDLVTRSSGEKELLKFIDELRDFSIT